MSKLVMLAGLPASGKSKLGEELAKKYDGMVFSSDKIREELGDVNDQSNNELVFKTLHERIQQHLANDGTAIYDATNINKKRRIHAITQLFKADEYVCYYMATPYKMCLQRDKARERQVGQEVIDHMYKNLQVPFKDEGWDEVIYKFPMSIESSNNTTAEIFLENILKKSSDHDALFDYLSEWSPSFTDMRDFAQDSTYHSFSVSRHTLEVLKGTINAGASDYIKLVALFHDIGKPFTKSFFNYKGEPKKYASFVGHENVGAQITMIVMHKLGFPLNVIVAVSRMVQYHMLPLTGSEKVDKRLRKWLTNFEYEDLMMLHKADQEGH